MPKVPELNFPILKQKSKTIYCLPPGASEADIAQIDKFITHIRIKRKKR